jgi:hypothetical protein
MVTRRASRRYHELQPGSVQAGPTCSPNKRCPRTTVDFPGTLGPPNGWDSGWFLVTVDGGSNGWSNRLSSGDASAQGWRRAGRAGASRDCGRRGRLCRGFARVGHRHTFSRSKGWGRTLCESTPQRVTPSGALESRTHRGIFREPPVEGGSMKRALVAAVIAAGITIGTVSPAFGSAPPPTNGGNGAGHSGQCTGNPADRPASCQP